MCPPVPSIPEELKSLNAFRLHYGFLDNETYVIAHSDNNKSIIGIFKVTKDSVEKASLEACQQLLKQNKPCI